MYIGICVTILITFFWVSTTHCFKFLFLPSTKLHHSISSSFRNTLHHHTTSSVLKTLTLPYTKFKYKSEEKENTTFKPIKERTSLNETDSQQFQAPFFASWFSTNFVILFFPTYLIFREIARKCGKNTETVDDILRSFRERGYTFGRFIYRCISFCILWVKLQIKLRFF